MVTSLGRVLALVAAACALVACGSSSDAEDDAGPATVESILVDAAAAMADVETAAFTIEQTGATVFIDDDQLAFRSAEGRFARPSSAEALVSVDALGFATQIGAIAIDGTLWFTNPLTGAWSEAPPGFTFDPATLFDAEVGLPALLSEASETAQLVDDSSNDSGVEGDTHHLRTSVAPERVSVLTGGLITDETEVDLWIDVETGRVVEVRFELPIDDSTSSWRMTVGDYDAEVTIAPPELGSTG